MSVSRTKRRLKRARVHLLDAGVFRRAAAAFTHKGLIAVVDRRLARRGLY